MRNIVFCIASIKLVILLLAATPAAAQPIHCGGYWGEGCMNPHAREQLYRRALPRNLRGAYGYPSVPRFREPRSYYGLAPRPLGTYGYAGSVLVPGPMVPLATCVRNRRTGVTVCFPYVR